jgi:hypothetical protein
VLRVYVIFTVPPDTPVTIPFAAKTVATPISLLLHVPPAVDEASVIDEPTQTDDEPTMTAGNGFTVIVVPIPQPAPGE